MNNNLFEKKERVNELLDNYDVLLTEKQVEILNMYYADDLSLSEIAELMNVTKAAIADLIKRSINILERYEVKLRLIEKKKEIAKIIETLPEGYKEKIEKLI